MSPGTPLQSVLPVYLASISILANVFTKISVHLYAAAVVLERVVGWSPLTAAVILVVATGIYTVAGGST